MQKVMSIGRAGLLFVLTFAWLGISPATITAGNLAWTHVNIPTEGTHGKWVMAAGADIRCLTRAPDGTFYCYANPTGTPYRLFKSMDNGSSWGYCGRVEQEIIDIAVLPDNLQQIYYATESEVYRSDDGGSTFRLIGADPGGSGASGIEITGLDVVEAEGQVRVIVGTRDKAKLAFGGVYELAGDVPGAPWVDTGAGQYDFCWVGFSPHYASDRQLVAIGTDERDTVVITATGNGTWGQTTGETRLPGRVPVTASIAFPDDYDAGTPGKNIQFMALNTGSAKGDIFRLAGRPAPANGEVIDLNAASADDKAGLDFANLSVTGNAQDAHILCGAADASRVYYSMDGGSHWQISQKPPSGGQLTCVLLDPEAATGLAYAATGGTESAFSISRDGGKTWNQTGLIDTRLTAILDLAISPNYSQDSTLFLLTADQQNSLWRSKNGGQSWERVYVTSTAGRDRLSLVTCSPDYGEKRRILLSGTLDGHPAIWESMDDGAHFNATFSIDPATGAPVAIDAWIMTPAGQLFVAGFDGAKSIIYQTAAGGLTYIDQARCGNSVITSLAVSPAYPDDQTILAGDRSGGVFSSTDGGRIFEPVGIWLNGSCLTADVQVAFDNAFKLNRLVYAGGGNADAGIYRFNLGSNGYWESLANSLPAGSKVGHLEVSPSGVLYALNTQTVQTGDFPGGIERCLHPAGAAGSFETIATGLTDGGVLKCLRASGNNLWTVDAVHLAVLEMSDTLTEPISLMSPPDFSAGQPVHNLDLTWTAVPGVTLYHWQLGTDDLFPESPERREGDTGSNTVRIAALDKDSTYYWRVKACQPVASPWSETRSFNTLETGIPTLTEPRFGSTASLSPVFRWNAAGVGLHYQFQLAPDSGFAATFADQICGTNFWECQTTLLYGTHYYWRVKSLNGDYQSPWSEIFMFITASDPALSMPGVPKVSEPRSSSASSICPAFKWTAVENAQQYELQVSRNDTFTDLVINRQGATACNANVWQCDVILQYSTSYYWRVRAVNGDNNGEWSEAGIFTTAAMPAPGGGGHGPGPTPSPSPAWLPAPKLVEPRSTGQVSINPIFRWSTSNGALHYELVVSTTDDFSLLTINKTGADACNANAWVCLGGLDYGTSYYWKVRASDATRAGLWSEVGIFTTEDQALPPAKPTPSSGSVPATSNPVVTQPSPPALPPSTPAFSPSPAATGGPATALTTAAKPGPPVEENLVDLSPASQTTTLKPEGEGVQAAPATPTPTPTPVLADSSRRLIYFLIAGLVILTGIMAGVVVYILRKFKQF